MKRIILALTCVLVLLGLLAFLWPKDGINLLGIELKFPSINEALFNEKPQYADITKIADESELDKKQDKDTRRVSVKEDNIVELTFPNNNESLLYDFFSSIDNIKSSKSKIRILHYGDSQLEGDRITSYIRQRLQAIYSGKGQGDIPIHSVSNVANVIYSFSPNFHFFSITDHKKSSFSRFGIMQSAAVPYVLTLTDTADNSTTTYKKGIINLRFISPLRQNISLYYSNPNTVSSIKVFSKTDLLAQKDIDIDPSLSHLEVPINKKTYSLRFEIDGSPELYYFDISSQSGIYVDNIALRGSTGYGFNRTNSEFMRKMCSMMDVRLIILQFGSNVSYSSYGHYKKMFSKEIVYLKKVCPNAQIIIIGAPDRSEKIGDNYQTNPTVLKLIEVQKILAKENNCIYWDLFTAMGGKNSMPSWVLRAHPLANPDFTHFNAYGAKYIAELFYQALEKAYNDYHKRKGT